MAENTNTPKMQQGKDKFLMFRLLEQATEEDAKHLVFQTGHTFEYSRSMDRVTTKDGSLIRPGGLEATVSIEAIQATSDPTAAFLEQAVIDGKELELWEINFDETLKNDEGEYPAIYARGFLDSWSLPAEVDGEATISSNFNVEMTPQKGFTKVSKDIVEAAQYAFRGIGKVTETP